MTLKDLFITKESGVGDSKKTIRKIEVVPNGVTRFEHNQTIDRQWREEDELNKFTSFSLRERYAGYPSYYLFDFLSGDEFSRFEELKKILKTSPGSLFLSLQEGYELSYKLDGDNLSFQIRLDGATGAAQVLDDISNGKLVIVPPVVNHAPRIQLPNRFKDRHSVDESNVYHHYTSILNWME